MTLRMSFLHVAMATTALMIADVVAARAATKFCDIYPERCQYAADGIYYYYPLGYRMPGSTATPPVRARKNISKHKKPTMTARKSESGTGAQPLHSSDHHGGEKRLEGDTARYSK
jgi:hypothetical protein